MIYVIAFLIGVALGAIAVFALCMLSMLAARRQIDRRMGYLDLTTLSASHEGRDASAKPGDSDELSGGPTSRPPTHLRMIKGGRR